jgi:3-deoxy-manno-octulosonate cytidylyltransferase (CMP-KDO synthetase)
MPVRSPGRDDAADRSSVAVIIPARYASSRLPAKALADIAGEPMIVHVWRRARAARGVDRVIVATDDERIARAVETAGGRAVTTRADHPAGTDRIAEVCRTLDDEIVVNVQGDLPLLDPSYVEAAVAPLRAGASGDRADEQRLRMSTLATPLRPGEAERPQVVKVVRDRRGDALYFSRSPIPWPGETGLRHIGLYAYRRSFLLELAGLEPTPLERSERLEQLRALENGYRIRVEIVAASDAMIEVDTQEDLDRAREAAAAAIKARGGRPSHG